jgi:hypothetical protein
MTGRIGRRDHVYVRRRALLITLPMLTAVTASGEQPIHLRVHDQELTATVFVDGNYVAVTGQDLTDYPDVGGLYVTISAQGFDVGEFFWCFGQPAADARLEVQPNAKRGVLSFASTALSSYDYEGNEVPCPRQDISIVATCVDTGTIFQQSMGRLRIEAFDDFKTHQRFISNFRQATCDVQMRVSGSLAIEQSDALGTLLGGLTSSIHRE